MINALRDPIDGIKFSVQTPTAISDTQLYEAIIKFLLAQLEAEKRAKLGRECQVPSHFVR